MTEPTSSAGRVAGYDALILDAASRQSLACVRSLGRAGLRVAAAECFAECDPLLPVLSFRSRYCAREFVLPSFAADPQGFGAAVTEFVREHPTRVVLPTSDGAISAMAPWRGKLADLGCALALPPDPVLAVTNDKDQTLALARKLGIAYPESILLHGIDDLPGLLAEFDFPFVLKPTISWTGLAPARLQPTEVVNEAEAIEVITRFTGAGADVLAQQWMSGRREGVTLFVSGGEVVASCGHIAHRTSPALGGASILRESMATPPDIYDPAVALVSAVGMDGVCEVEFRRDAQGRPMLMEINTRLAGTLENAMCSGVDFPLMVWRWAAGLPIDRHGGYPAGVRTRWLYGEMRWLRDNRRRVGRPDSTSRGRAIWNFTREFFRTPHYDTLDWRDLGPARAELRITVAAVRKSRDDPAADHLT